MSMSSRFSDSRPDQLFSDGKTRRTPPVCRSNRERACGSPKSKHQTMISERETRFSRKPTSENNRSRARKSQNRFERKLFSRFSKEKFWLGKCGFSLLFRCFEIFETLLGNFFIFLAADWRSLAGGLASVFLGRGLCVSALVLFCVGEEGGGVFFGGGDFAAEHAGEFVDALFGF